MRRSRLCALLLVLSVIAVPAGPEITSHLETTAAAANTAAKKRCKKAKKSSKTCKCRTSKKTGRRVCSPRKKTPSQTPGGRPTSPVNQAPGATTPDAPIPSGGATAGAGIVTMISDDSLTVDFTSTSDRLGRLLDGDRSVEIMIRDTVDFSVDGSRTDVGVEDVCIGDKISVDWDTGRTPDRGSLESVAPRAAAVTAENDCFANG